MIYRFLADLVVVLHVCFVVFVMLGGFLLLKWPRLIYAHVPAALWGVMIEFGGWICPLTPLENALRVKGGEAGYHGDFIDHYVLALLYPHGLTRGIQWILGGFALTVNVIAYTIYFRRRIKTDRA
jgi:hypothetical protein